MDKYYIDYTIPTANIKISDKIEFKVDNQKILKAEICQENNDSLFVRFVYNEETDFTVAFEETKKLLNNILNKISFYYDYGSVGGAYYKCSNLNSCKSHSDFNCCVTVNRPTSIEELKEALLDDKKCEHRLHEMFRFATQSTDPVNKYMFLYQILLNEYGPYQSDVDKYILLKEKAGIIDAKYREYQVGRKSETIFTFLRNQVGHVVKEATSESICTPKSITENMTDKMHDLIYLVKEAIKDVVERENQKNI